MKIILTEEQQEVVNKFGDFLLDPNERLLIIQGHSGCGKTSIIESLVNKASSCDLDLLLGATTNKATNVLNELLTDAKARTILPILHLTLKKNYSTGKLDTIKTKKWKPITNSLLILDESSMLSDDVFELMRKTMIGNSKIVLIGDIYQLAPVKNASQKVPTVPVMERLLHKVPTIVMTTVMRHKGSILEASAAFRKTVETGIFKNILLAENIIHVAGNEFKNKIENAQKNITVPHLIIHAKDDPSVLYQEALNLNNWNQKSELFTIDYSNHVFDAKHPWKEKDMPDNLEKVVNKTIAFIKC